VGICSGIFAFKLSQDRNVDPERRLLALLGRDRASRQSAAASVSDAEGESAVSEIQQLLDEQQRTPR
jgi:hypothetical protein